MAGLRRLAAGPYKEEQAVSFEKLNAMSGPEELDALLLPVSSAVDSWPIMRLHQDTAHYLLRGQPVQVAHAPTEGGYKYLNLARKIASSAWVKF